MAKNFAKEMAYELVVKRAKKAWAELKSKVEPQTELLRTILKDGDAKKKLETLFKKVAHGNIDAEVQTIAKWLASKILGKKIAQAQGRRSAVATCAGAVPFADWPKSFSLTIGVQVSGITPKFV